ncbi:MAG: ATP-binding protein, partial [Prolixibacteraceae bacterium]
MKSGEIEFDYFFTDNEKDYLNILETENIDLILSDFNLPEYNGNEALKIAREKYAHIPFIFVSGMMGEDAAINSMLSGATDYVLKNKLERLVPAIKRGLSQSEIERQRKQAEKDLEESREMLYEAQKLAHIGVWSWKADVDIVTWTDELYHIAGLDPKLPAPTYAESSTIYSPQSWHLLKTAVEKAMTKGEPYRLELELIRPDGTIRNVNAFGGVKLDDKGHVSELLGTVQDITERKLAEIILKEKKDLIEVQNKKFIQINKELAFQNEEKEKRAVELIIAREKAEESDNLKSAFLHNLSHEIRTPMNQIVGFASLLQDSELTESLRNDYIDIINDQSTQLLHIITAIVEISEITTGQVHLKLVTFNLGKMMNELLASFKPKAEHRNLKLSLTKKIADADAMIQGDFVKLKEVFSNLIENAIKFTDTGSIDIEYSRVGDRLIVVVKDTGIGIGAHEKQVIFDNFRQIEITAARKYSGLGLGLSISNAYIRMMSGVIRVESEPGTGSTFIVDIPYLPAIRISEPTIKFVQPHA